MWDTIFGFLKPVFGIIDKAVLDKTEAEKLKVALQTGIMNGEFKEFETLVNARMNIIMAEAQGKGWLQNNWRPLMMVMFGSIILNNYIVFPYVDLFGYKAMALPVPPDLWALLKLGIGGYVVGRSAEKIIPGIVEAVKNKG
jgi:hypothetical protein